MYSGMYNSPYSRPGMGMYGGMGGMSSIGGMGPYS